MYILAKVVLWTVLLTMAGLAQAGEFGSLFKDKEVEVYPKKGVTEEKAKEQAEAALKALANLTFLSENDARQYARNIQAILGY